MAGTDARKALDLIGRQEPQGGVRERFALTEMERQSALWKKLKAHAEERIARHRRANDGDKDMEATSKLRGRIQEARYFAALDEPAPQMEADHA